MDEDEDPLIAAQRQREKEELDVQEIQDTDDPSLKASTVELLWSDVFVGCK